MKFNSFRNKLDLLCEFFSELDKEEIFEKFCQELLETGSNVNKDCKIYGVTKHVFNDQMLNLYKNSNSFIFELLISASKKEKINKDTYVTNYISNVFKSKKENILCYGDGIGLDSIMSTMAGFKTTYFDVDGLTSNFAKFLFSKNNLSNQIEIVHNEKFLSANSFDVIICREVLEHLTDPLKIIKNMRKILKNNGICIISESFTLVKPQFPTHLKSNLKFSGKCIKIFVEEGFNYLEQFENSNLYIFQKTEKVNRKRFLTIPNNRKRDKLKKILRDKLIYYLS